MSITAQDEAARSAACEQTFDRWQVLGVGGAADARRTPGALSASERGEMACCARAKMGRSMSTPDGAIGGTDPAKNEADFLRRVAPPCGCGLCRRGRLDVLGVALDIIVGEATL